MRREDKDKDEISADQTRVEDESRRTSKAEEPCLKLQPRMQLNQGDDRRHAASLVLKKLPNLGTELTFMTSRGLLLQFCGWALFICLKGFIHVASIFEMILANSTWSKLDRKRYDKRRKCEETGIVPTEMRATMEQTTTGDSLEFYMITGNPDGRNY
ncbi:hypothetical protein Tco_1157342 [Tanacetum coccineum]